jgi:predicted transcriptional regulator
MATSVHIPKSLLAAVDRRARALRVSRSRLIVKALEREVGGADWSPGFLESLRTTDATGRAAVDDMLSAIRRGRRSKKPPKL